MRDIKLIIIHDAIRHGSTIDHLTEAERKKISARFSEHIRKIEHEIEDRLDTEYLRAIMKALKSSVEDWRVYDTSYDIYEEARTMLNGCNFREIEEDEADMTARRALGDDFSHIVNADAPKLYQ